jgi:hypothetical protein
MRGDHNRWVVDFMIDFMWHHEESDPDRYLLCVGIVCDPQCGNLHNHVWIEDTATAEALNKYTFKRKIELTPKADYYRLMKPRYIKSYSGREMLKKALKAGAPALLENVPSRVSGLPNFKGPWDNGLRLRKQTGMANR